MVDVLCSVSAPMPAVLLEAPCSDKPPVLKVPPVNVALAELPIRSLLVVPLEFANSNVPPEFTVMLLVFARRAVVEPALSRESVPLLMVVAPV